MISIGNNGDCPRCFGWIMPPDEWGERGCINCGWYDYFAYFSGGNGHEEPFETQVVILPANIKPLQTIETDIARYSAKKKQRSKINGNGSGESGILSATIKPIQTIEADVARCPFKNKQSSKRKLARILIRLPDYLAIHDKGAGENRIVTLSFTKKHKPRLVVKTTCGLKDGIRAEYENKGFRLQKIQQ